MKLPLLCILFVLLTTMFLVGCWTAKEEQPIEVKEKEAVKPVEVGTPVEKVEKSEEKKEEAKIEEKKEEAKPEEKKVEETKEEKKEEVLCDKDLCIGNILQKCVLGKAPYNITCPELCKDGKCIAKEITEEEFTFADMYVGKTLGSRKQVLAENDLKALSSTRTNTLNGITDVKYLLRLGGDTEDPIESGEIVYAKNRAGKIGDYLKYVQKDDIFEYIIDFSRGLESKISSDYDLTDILGAKISFFGMPYQLIGAQTDSSQKGVSLKFLRGDEIALLEEGKAQSFMQGTTEYEVQITSIKNDKVRMSVNGKLSPELAIGDVFKADDTFTIAIKDLFASKVGGETKWTVEFFIGGDQIEFVDNDVSNNVFERNVRVNGAQLEHGRVMIRATSRSGSMRIDLIKYRADAKGSENDVFIAPGEDLRKLSAEPLSLLTKNWNLTYDGLNKEKENPVEIKHRSSRTYELSFVNTQGRNYIVPLMDSTSVLKYGDDNQDLVFIEDAAGNIKVDDYFVLTDTNNERGITAIYQLLSFDRDNKNIQLKDLAGTTRDATYSVDANGIGAGSFSISGKNYNFVVPANGSHIGIDLNGNGNVANDKVMIIAAGGLMIDLGSEQNISAKTSQDILFTTTANKLIEKQINEDVKVTISKGNEINLQAPDQTTLHLDSIGDTLKGMTPYGTLYEITGATLKDLKIMYPEEQRIAAVKLKIILQ